jgi:hypothetical protein
MPYGLGMSMHQSRSSVPLRVPAVTEGEFMMRNTYVMVLTCNILAMDFRTLTNTFRTSRETVSAEGIWYPGLPVFIRLRKARSVTILNGRLLSDTQRTISAL